MRRALPGSVLVHSAIIGVAFVGFAWPEAEDAPAAEAVSVSIVTMASVSANATAVVQSDSTVDQVSAGAATTVPPTIEPIEPDTVEPTTEAVVPLEPKTQQPVTETAVEPLEAPVQETAEPPVEPPLPAEAAVQATTAPEPSGPVASTTEVAILSSPILNALASQSIATARPQTIEPLSSEHVKLPPVPQTLGLVRTSKPTYPRPQPQQPAPRQPETPPPSSTAGNAGNNNADAVASAGSTAVQVGNGNGGDAEVARYPSEVLRKLRGALRSNRGPSGEVVVRFTVLASGQVIDVGIGRSSGNNAVDQAGLATVGRAAPFPAIPAAASRSSWTFDVPLAFGG